MILLRRLAREAGVAFWNKWQSPPNSGVTLSSLARLGKEVSVERLVIRYFFAEW